MLLSCSNSPSWPSRRGAVPLLQRYPPAQGPLTCRPCPGSCPWLSPVATLTTAPKRQPLPAAPSATAGTKAVAPAAVQPCGGTGGCAALRSTLDPQHRQRSASCKFLMASKPGNLTLFRAAHGQSSGHFQERCVKHERRQGDGASMRSSTAPPCGQHLTCEQTHNLEMPCLCCNTQPRTPSLLLSRPRIAAAPPCGRSLQQPYHR